MADVQDAPAGPVLGERGRTRREFDLLHERLADALWNAAKSNAVNMTAESYDDVIAFVLDEMAGPVASLLSSAREEGRKDCAEELDAVLADASGSGWDLTERLHVLVNRWKS